MKNGFTLAEVLITLVIIGIIAAMTIPSIIANYSEQESISRAKKAYSTLSQGIRYVKVLGGDYTEWEISSTSYANVGSMINQIFQVSKYCGYSKAGCWSTEAKMLNGSSYWRDNGNGVGFGDQPITFILNDGTLVNFAGNELVSQVGVSDSTTNTIVFFDVNGEKAPNKVGKDIYVAVIGKDGLVPAYIDNSVSEIENDCSPTGTGVSCLIKYLKNSK